MKLKKELEAAISAAKLAGDKIMSIYTKDFAVCYKDDKSPVTEADVLANKLILETLSGQFPDDGYLSEEVRDDSSRFEKDRFWVIDPLDGTKEFVKKNGEFSVNIGLVDHGEVVLGVIYIPVRRRVYFAVKGEGAHRQEENGETARIHVSNRVKPFNMLISRSHTSKRTISLLKMKAFEMLSLTEMGSALKGCLIAEGLYDVYYNFGHSMKWDTCAMECIIEEAGGIIRRLDDAPIDYTEVETKNYGFYIINNAQNHIDISDL